MRSFCIFVTSICPQVVDELVEKGHDTKWDGLVRNFVKAGDKNV